MEISSLEGNMTIVVDTIILGDIPLVVFGPPRREGHFFASFHDFDTLQWTGEFSTGGRRDFESVNAFAKTPALEQLGDDVIVVVSNYKGEAIAAYSKCKQIA
jgi:hypothetical protein